ncbi:putative WD repeat and HMG box DNA binding protein [Trypanosoma vivax]|uniref:Uncharacterized protein n=1 Tax=Trypanosoma vivax (strain Y486) TaxID=1055687 RepID=G0TRI7_TRYVY|nr:hypothetical protein TRVL_02507 [Trypanosoma vivax]KAH8604062.1 putative WD repeat and HMG box DNA binding protein [Trypanosoma vivax]CCC46552.1 conserved hypothetical protein [Trypanosoma vivax Y486]
MNLPEHKIHQEGTTRVSTDGGYTLTGGPDGVVALLLLRRFPTKPLVWKRKCHEGAVTCVQLHAVLNLAVSCGRDGIVMLHENVIPDNIKGGIKGVNENGGGNATSAHIARAVCRVTGELRVVLFDAERRRIFIGGDSLRCLHMLKDRYVAQTIPTHVPYPLVSLALSPCGNLLAIASSSSALSVVSVCPAHLEQVQLGSQKSVEEGTLSQGDAQNRRIEHLKNVKITCDAALTPIMKRDDAVAFRLSWCRAGDNNDTLFLFVPGITESRAFRLVSTKESPYSYNLESVGNVDSLDLANLIGVTCYPLSARTLCAVLVGTSGVVVTKVDCRNWSVKLHRKQNCTDVTDAVVDMVSGDIVVGTRSGTVMYMQREAPKLLVDRREVNGTGTGVSRKTEKLDAQSLGSGSQSSSQCSQTKDRSVNRSTGSSDVGNYTPVEDNSDGSGDDVTVYSGTSSSASNENLKQVVSDLKRTNPGYDEAINGKERPSRWRQDDPRKVVRALEQERGKGQTRSAFLDDEAEESSGDGGVSRHSRGSSSSRGWCVARGWHGSVNRGNEEDMDGTEYGSVLGKQSHGSSQQQQQTGTGIESPKGKSENAPAGIEDYFFQIGSTPVGEGGTCYLAYNSVGYIHCTPDGTTIHFHDMSLKPVRVLERGAILMAALSPVGAAFVIAQELTEMDCVDDTVPCLTIYFRTFISIGAQSDWRVRLNAGEVVRCLAVGVRHTAVSTSYYLRIFSLSGLQLAVVSLFPRIVTMVGTNSQKIMQFYGEEFDPLAVCYLETGGEMKVQVLDVGSRTVVVPATTVPLTPTHQLQWMGWSDDGPLHIVDTAGVLQMFTKNWGGSWVPLYDPRCLSDQTYNLWIWGVSDEAMLAYRSCKSDPPYPAAAAGALPTERVKLFIPLLRGGTEREMVTWDRLLRQEIRTDEIKRCSEFYTDAIARRDVLHDKEILKLFNGAVQEQQTSRALELAMFLELRENIEVCAKEANAQGQAQLVQKLVCLLDMRTKTKRKRRCSLPLERSAVSEKERDMLLRKLLAKEKFGNVAGSGKKEGADGASTNGDAATVPPENRSLPAESVVSVEQGSVHECNSQTRRVKFMDEQAPIPKQLKSATTATDAGACGITPSSGDSVVSTISYPSPHKPMNPFKSLSVNRTADATSAPEPPKQLQKPVNPFKGAAKSNVPTRTPLDGPEGKSREEQKLSSAFFSSLATSANLSQNTCSLDGGDELQCTPPPSMDTSNTTRLGQSPSYTNAASSMLPSHNGINVQSPGAASVRSCDNGGIGKCNSVAKHTKRSSPARASVSSRGSLTITQFIPKVQPAQSIQTNCPDEAVDPFLDISDGTPVSLDSLLVDVGHEPSEPSVPRSASFGAALRKRYREEDGESSSESASTNVVEKQDGADLHNLQVS